MLCYSRQVHREATQSVQLYCLRKYTDEEAMVYVSTTLAEFPYDASIQLIATLVTGENVVVFSRHLVNGQDQSLVFVTERRNCNGFNYCANRPVREMPLVSPFIAFQEEARAITFCRRTPDGDELGVFVVEEGKSLSERIFPLGSIVGNKEHVRYATVCPGKSSANAAARADAAVLLLSSGVLRYLLLDKQVLDPALFDLSSLQADLETVHLLVTRHPLLLAVFRRHGSASWCVVGLMTAPAGPLKRFSVIDQHELGLVASSKTSTFSLVYDGAASYLVACTPIEDAPPVVQAFSLSVSFYSSDLDFADSLSGLTAAVKSPPLNMILDHCYHIFDKFPVTSAITQYSVGSCEGAPRRLTFEFLVEGSETKAKALASYAKDLHGTVSSRLGKSFAGLFLEYRGISKSEHLLTTAGRSTEGSLMALGDLLVKVICLTPIQVARVEFSTFRPLRDGLALHSPSAHDEVEAVVPVAAAAAAPGTPETSEGLTAEELGESLTFGMYDAVLASHDLPVTVICCMGCQSSGKSSLLNQLGGTLFDVSGGRCTDGVWMSIKVLPHRIYVLLDFEGLGSFERTHQQDMFLALVGAAMGSVCILRVTMQYDRFTESTLRSLGDGGRLLRAGPTHKFFGGRLIINPRDVQASKTAEVFREFKDKVNSTAAKYIQELSETERQSITRGPAPLFGLFHDWLFQPTPQFASMDYNRTALAVFQSIDSLEPKFETGTEFRHALQLVLARIGISDFSTLDETVGKRTAQFVQMRLRDALCTGLSMELKGRFLPGVTVSVAERLQRWNECAVPLRASLVSSQRVVSEPTELCVLISDPEQAVRERVAQLCSASFVLVSPFPAGQSLSFTQSAAGNGIELVVHDLHDAGLHLSAIESLCDDEDKARASHLAELHRILIGVWDAILPLSGSEPQRWKSNFQAFVKAVVERRFAKVCNWIDQLASSFDEKMNLELIPVRRELKSLAQITRMRWTLCSSKCSKCFYPCLLCSHVSSGEVGGHAVEHDCLGTHCCAKDCDFCALRGESVVCAESAGHFGKHHCRKQAHECGEPCSQSTCVGCNKVCSLEIGHTGTHWCSTPPNAHLCGCQCSAASCSGQCTYPYSQPHDRHLCSPTARCPMRCQLCTAPCKSENHFHSEDDPVAAHLCEQDHQCPHHCEEPGICSIDTRRFFSTKQYKTKTGQDIQYEEFSEQNGQRRECCIRIPAGKLAHQGDHTCIIKDADASVVFHFCGERCACCKYYCTKRFGHPADEPHDCNHGNMRSTKLLCAGETMNVKSHSFGRGDSGIVFLCPEACRQRGRGHLHLIPCRCTTHPREDTVRRHDKTVSEDGSKQYDVCTCAFFWANYLGFRGPFSDDEAHSFSLCGCHCASEHQSGQQQEPQYCQLPCMHMAYVQGAPLPQGAVCGTISREGGHVFPCTHMGGLLHTILLIDSSGSMDSGDVWPSFPWLSHLHNRLGAVLEATDTYVKLRAAASPSDLVTLIAFNNTASVIRNSAPASPGLIQSLCRGLNAHGGTCFNSALRAALRYLPQPTERTDHRFVIIFFSDGGDWSQEETKPLLSLIADKYPADRLTVHTVSFGSPDHSDSAYLQELATIGRGQHQNTVNRLEMVEAFQTLATLPDVGDFVPH